MIALVAILFVTNAALIAALVLLIRERTASGATADPTLDAALATATPLPSSSGQSRRLISIEILNPTVLAEARGRVAAMASSLAPGLARRIVYDQAVKLIRKQLTDEGVVADVRIHHIRPVHPDRPALEQPGTSEPGPGEGPDVADHPRLGVSE